MFFFRDAARWKWESKEKNLASTYKSTSSIFSVRKSLLKPSLWSLWPALLFLKTDLLCAKILCFSIETCLLRGDIDVSFLAGVMIWWIRISKPGTILAFMLVFFLCVSLSRFFFSSLPLSPGSNPHFSNEYKYLFCGCVSWRHIGCFSTIKVFVGAAGCNAATLERADASALFSPSQSLTHTYTWPKRERTILD